MVESKEVRSRIAAQPFNLQSFIIGRNVKKKVDAYDVPNPSVCITGAAGIIRSTISNSRLCPIFIGQQIKILEVAGGR